VRVHHGGDLGGQALRVRACAIAPALVDDAIVFNQCDASRSRRRIQRYYTHQKRFQLSAVSSLLENAIKRNS
jgi:hypothetical protein